jgi:hypothetical protein
MENKEQIDNINNKIEHNKNYKYRDERKVLTKKLLQIIGITNTNKMFDSYELDNDVEKQKNILDLKPEIEQYYKVAGWSYYRKGKKKTRPYISITKSLLKDMKINVISSSKKKKIENKSITHTIYTILNNVDEYMI